MDIASAINNLAKAIFARSIFTKTEIIPSYTTIPSTVVRSISQDNYPTGMKVFYVVLKVRSMGTATYIAVGRPGNTQERLTVVGEIYEAEAPKNAYLDTREIMMVSDTADAVLEVGGVLVPTEFLP